MERKDQSPSSSLLPTGSTSRRDKTAAVGDMATSIARHPFFLGLLGTVSIAFFALLVGFWEPIFWAAVIGVLFRPVEVKLTTRLGGRATLASVLTVVLIFFTVLVPAMLLASAVTAEAVGVYQRIRSGELNVGAVVDWLQNLAPHLGEWAARFGLDLSQLSEKLTAAVEHASRFVASLALSAGQNLASFVLMFFLMLYLLFFVLRDGDAILRRLERALPLPDEQERSLFLRFAEVARATIKGTLVIGMLQGFLGGLIFAILGIQGAVFWGMVMAVLSLVPAVGSGLVWGPAAIFLLVTGDWLQGLVLLAYGVLVISMADNLLRPLLVGRNTRIPDYLILFSTLGGLALVGITGFVLGPVVAALFISAWQMYEQDRAPGTSEPGAVTDARPTLPVSASSAGAAEDRETRSGSPPPNQPSST